MERGQHPNLQAAWRSAAISLRLCHRLDDGCAALPEGKMRAFAVTVLALCLFDEKSSPVSVRASGS
jgi:hypothetical protein